MVGLDFSYHCREYKGGSSEPANIRVHEIFKNCPKVGEFAAADKRVSQLVFVTRETNVDLKNKTMGNIPQKHIGIFHDGHVYHYSNSRNEVVKWTPETFLTEFDKIYSGKQGLFFGTFPGSSLLLDIVPSAQGITQGIPFVLEKRGDTWFAQATLGANQDLFYVGKEVNNQNKGYFGLYLPVSKYYGEKYAAEDYVEQIDHWAHIIDATAFCESKSYMNLINTYDRAKFTFGFYQLAAHTPKDNLILLFRQLMNLSQAKNYFPELTIHDGALHRLSSDGGLVNLEEPLDKQLQLFMNFLNPRRKLIDEQEVLNAARLMHWTASDPEFREAQVKVSADILQKKMSKRYHRWYGLDGASDTICTIIADIHHHGRASRKTVEAALKEANKEKALLEVNNEKYKDRNSRLKKKIKQMKDLNLLGKKTYDSAMNEFYD